MLYRIFTMNDHSTGQDSAGQCCDTGMLPEGASLAADEELAVLAKALGHPARVQIMRLLIARTECICGEICGEIPLAQSTISQHLKVLKNAGLIMGEIDGPRVCYCINPARLARLKALIGAL